MPGASHHRSPGFEPWIVVLAGGEGERLRGRYVAGKLVDRPKQFCSLVSDQTLLADALARADHLGRRERVIVCVCEAHRRWWRPALARRPEGTVMVQPRNLGTAVAILQSLLRILDRDDDPILVVLPSDHAVDPETAMVEGLAAAARAARDHEGVVLMGAEPRGPEEGYGWIVPGRSSGGMMEVVDFVEKPSVDRARALMRRGALWSTFALAASGRALLELFESAQPEILERFVGLWDRLVPPEHAFERVAASLPSLDFSRDVLRWGAHRLWVAPIPSCDWTDLGTPARVEAWLDRFATV